MLHHDVKNCLSGKMPLDFVNIHKFSFSFSLVQPTKPTFFPSDKFFLKNSYQRVLDKRIIPAISQAFCRFSGKETCYNRRISRIN